MKMPASAAGRSVASFSVVTGRAAAGVGAGTAGATALDAPTVGATAVGLAGGAAGAAHALIGISAQATAASRRLIGVAPSVLHASALPCRGRAAPLPPVQYLLRDGILVKEIVRPRPARAAAGGAGGRMSECLFCRIISGEITGDVVYRDEQLTAFRDINPQAPTHVLIVPNEHLTSTAEMGEQHVPLMGRIVHLASELARQEGLQ